MTVDRKIINDLDFQNAQKVKNAVDGSAPQDYVTMAQLAAAASPVDSVFGRTGAVVAVAGDYYGSVAAALTGATQASRYVGATASGAPASGTFVKGDWVVAQDGHIFVCTSGGTPGTWQDVGGGGGATYGTPAIVLGTAAAAGSIDEAIRRDSTIIAFDTTVPTTQAFGDAAATGSAAVAARRDHKHAMPANPFSGAAAGGSLSGAYPNPGIASGAVGPTELASTAVTPSTYGDATHVGQFTVDGDGRLTAASAVAITPAAAAAGTTQLVYRYTVAGSDKASIDTGVDTPDAGSNDWTNGDLLEILIYSRIDEAVALGLLNLTFNNDSSALYIRVNAQMTDSTVAGQNQQGATKWRLNTAGANCAASVFAVNHISIPNYLGTLAFKVGDYSEGVPDTTASQTRSIAGVVSYRSTSALTRLAIVPETALKKFKVGTQLLIYKRTAS